MDYYLLLLQPCWFLGFSHFEAVQNPLWKGLWTFGWGIRVCSVFPWELRYMWIEFSEYSNADSIVQSPANSAITGGISRTLVTVPFTVPSLLRGELAFFTSGSMSYLAGEESEHSSLCPTGWDKYYCAVISCTSMSTCQNVLYISNRWEH
jgi:hypothetical protein